MLLGPLIDSGAGPYFAGALMLGAAVVVLRARAGIFLEQLAVPALLVGGGSLGFGLFRDLPDQAAALALMVLALGLAMALPHAWLPALLGALAAGLAGLSWLGPDHLFDRWASPANPWLACHGVLAVGLGLWAWQGHLRGPVRGHGARLDSLAAGWLLATLAGLCGLAGMTFLVGGLTGGSLVGDVGRELANAPGRRGWGDAWLPLLSAALGLLAVALSARAWRGLRQGPLAVVALALVGLCGLMPSLGGTLLVLSQAALAGRWRLAAAAAVAAAWIVGSFYYALAWPLATKAWMLVAAGAALGATAWWLMRRPTPAGGAVGGPSSGSAQTPWRDGRAAWVGLATLATLAVALAGIMQKESIIARGQPVYVELAPVDPRSLMQGDFMRLNFRVPPPAADLPVTGTVPRPRMVARRDARGVATLQRLHEAGTPLAADEMLLALTPKDGRWVLVTDAWFFREGDGERWARAKYGEFRVTPEGQALLVGMADAQLQPIRP
jgi:uncharacterized membrane-anchored protein